MAGKTIRKFLVIAITFASSVIFIPFSNAADVYSWNQPSTLGTGNGFRSAISSDGSVILVGKNSGGVFISRDAGQTFSRITSITTDAYGVAMSLDGTRMFASQLNGSSVYYSTDSGVSWTLKTNAIASANNYAACMSGDGSVWMTGAYAGNLYVSTDTGTTWTSVAAAGTAYFWNCYINFNGTKRFAQVYNAAMKYSTDSGATWTNSTTTISDAYCLGVSSDGSKIIIGSRTGSAIYRSTNGGVSFSLIYSTPAGVYVFGCTSSADGTKLIAVTQTGNVYVSSNSGTSWSIETTPGSSNWYNTSMNQDGTKVIVLAQASPWYYVGTITTPASMLLSSGLPSSISFRNGSLISVTTNYPGRVTFYANSKRIGNCVSVPTVSLVAICTYSPSIRGAVTITAKFVPTDVSKNSVQAELFKTAVITRSNAR